jgi:protein-L-isoaspartate O-methyltransferase
MPWLSTVRKKLFRALQNIFAKIVARWREVYGLTHHMGREISTSVERAAMNAIQIAAFGNAAEVVKAVDIPDVGAPAASKMVKPESDFVADIGAGTGYFSRRFARQVAHVYAEDVDPEALSFLRREALAEVTVVSVKPENPDVTAEFV